MDDRAYAFLDANILLHFRPPDEIDWPKLCKAKRVDLVIYPLLRTEVSNQKDMHREKHIRRRAGRCCTDPAGGAAGWADVGGSPPL